MSRLTMESSSSRGSHQEYKIAGHTVLFPCKPYPSQFSMMDKILKGIDRHQNCLLESPTGSGKSLALLCSALAWQASERRKMEMETLSPSGDCKSETCQCCCHNPKAEASPSHSSTGINATSTVTASSTAATASVASVTAHVGASPVGLSGNLGKSVSVKGCDDDDAIAIDDDSDEDFRPLKKFREPSKSSMVTKKKRPRISIEYEDSPPSSPLPATVAGQHTQTPADSIANSKISTNTADSAKISDPPSIATPCSACSCNTGAQKGAPKKIPKIFFGTRTHKQIAQIVRELRKTAYHDVSMTILASREHTCIHPQVSHSANKNEGCEQLMKDVGCRFKDRVMKFQSQATIKDMGLHTAWDLEDLVGLLKKKKACPYFVSRGLKDQSDLIICPYNYLVDPLIRDSMEINLKGQVVLLDEAHNIEDSIREAASQSITQEQIQRALADMDGLVEKGEKVADISKLRQMCHKLDQFIENKSSSLVQHDFEQSYCMWSGFDIIAQLNTLDLGLRKCEELTTVIASIKAAEQEAKQYAAGADVLTLSSATWTLLEQVFLVLRYLYKNNMKHAEDYRMSIVKSVQYVSLNPSGTWLNSRRYSKKTPVEVFTLNFWCMNPAVGFADFENCRCVILTSGTLSPMDSFQSELGQPFPLLLEANHVIKDSQVWVGAVGQGPDSTPLHAVFRNMESFGFQDSLGQLIFRVCTKVPKGILCFLPSYKTLEKLTSRWKSTGLWAQMQGHKHLMCEPRRSDSGDFEQIIRDYYSIIHRCADRDADSDDLDGAVFFAVCRGKVSEGLDFADDFARAVITVGIPYPNFKDIQVELKRKYNDKYQSSRGLLSGSLWYEIQAFRALNQALGRCIRHRNDWGALIVVDDRFIKNTRKYSNGLSKWVRSKLKVHSSCSAMLSSLSEFTLNSVRTQHLDVSLNSSQLPSTPGTPTTQASPPSILSPPPPLTPACAADSRSPLHDVSNVATSAFPQLPCLTTSTISSPFQHHLGPTVSSETKNASARNKGEQVVPSLTKGTKKDALSTRVAAASCLDDAAAQKEVITFTRQRTSCSSGSEQKMMTSEPGVQMNVSPSCASALVSVTSTAKESSGLESTITPATAPAQDVSKSSVVGPCVNDAQTPKITRDTGNVGKDTSKESAYNLKHCKVSVQEASNNTKPSQPQNKSPAILSSQTSSPSSVEVSSEQAEGERKTVSAGDGAVKTRATVRSLLSGAIVHDPLCLAAAQPGSSAPSIIKTLPTQGSGPPPGNRLLNSVPTGPKPGTVYSFHSAPGSRPINPALVAPKVVPLLKAAPAPLSKLPAQAIRPFMTVPASGVAVSKGQVVPVQPAGNCGGAPVVPPRDGASPVLNMLFMPVTDPSFQPVMIQVTLSPTPTVLRLSAALAAAVGQPEVTVPPLMQYVMFAKTPQQASQFTCAMQSLPPGQPPGRQPAAQGSGQDTGRVTAGLGTGTALPESVGESLIPEAGSSALPALDIQQVCAIQSVSTAEPTPNQRQVNMEAGTAARLPPSRLLGACTGGSPTSNRSTSPSLFGDSPTSPFPGANKEIQSKRLLKSGLSNNLPSIPGSFTPSMVSCLQKMIFQNQTSSGLMAGPISAGSVTRTSIAGNSIRHDRVSAPRPILPKRIPRDSSRLILLKRNAHDSSRLILPKRNARDSSVTNNNLPTTSRCEVGIRTSLKKRLFRNTSKKRAEENRSDLSPHQRAPALSVKREDSDTNNREEENIPVTGKSETHNAVAATEEREEKVERRVKGAKRRSLSLGGSSMKKRRSSDLLDNITQGGATCMKCATCDFLLLEGIRDSDFERRDNLPHSLKGMVDVSQTGVLYFKGTSVTERLKVPPTSQGNCRRQQTSGGMVAVVELIHCPQCSDHHQQSTTSTLLGAKLTLTDPTADTSSHQMWMFSHRVTVPTPGATP